MNCVEPYLKNFVEVSITENRSIEIKDFVKEVIKRKKQESHHRIDGSQEHKRWYTGYSGEVVIEEYLNVEFVDLSIGDSKDYHVPDLTSIDLNVGIKTVEYGKFPVIFNNSYKPEIIILKKNDLDFLVCGVASKDALNKYQSNSLILSPMLRSRGTKTGFYGFHKLNQFDSLQMLKTLL